MPPPPPPAVLPEMVELLTVRLPPLKIPLPVPPAVLPEMVELDTETVPPVKLSIPPPLPPAVLPEMVEFETVRVPELRMPPPLPTFVAVLPEMMELETVRVPTLFKAPPADVLAPETVTPEMAKFPPAEIVKILKLRLAFPLLPLIVRLEEPGPVMVRVPAVEVLSIAGKAELRVMLPVTAKMIVSDSIVRLESTIARLRESGPKSLLFNIV